MASGWKRDGKRITKDHKICPSSFLLPSICHPIDIRPLFFFDPIILQSVPGTQLVNKNCNLTSMLDRGLGGCNFRLGATTRFLPSEAASPEDDPPCGPTL